MTDRAERAPPAAQRRNQHPCLVRRRRICGRSRRRPRAAIASELVATCALDAAWPGSERGGEHQFPGAAMVQPHRRRAARRRGHWSRPTSDSSAAATLSVAEMPAREPEQQLLDAAVKRRPVSEARELERERELRARAGAARDRVMRPDSATTRNAFGAASVSGTISAAVAFSRPRSPGRSARSRTQAMCGALDSSTALASAPSSQIPPRSSKPCPEVAV